MNNKLVSERIEEQMSLIELKDVVQGAEAYSLREYESFISYSPDGYIGEGLYLDELDNVKSGIEDELFGMYCKLFSYDEFGTQNPYDLIQKRTSELFLEWEVINN